jgi:hypothetical protein
MNKNTNSFIICNLYYKDYYKLYYSKNKYRYQDYYQDNKSKRNYKVAKKYVSYLTPQLALLSALAM